MMNDDHPPRADEAPIALDAVAPSSQWVERLPDIGRDAARLREVRSAAPGDSVLAARWFLPLAAGVVVACWSASLRAPPAPPRAALILAASPREVLAVVSLEASP